MKKKLLTTALATTMVMSSVFTAMAAETKIDTKELKADSYEEMANPLKGKNAEKVTISYTINWNADAPKNGWDGIFSFFDAESTGRVSFQTAPYLCYNAGKDDKYIDVKADAWCTTNCETGKDYTFTYVITKDAITVACDGKNITEFTEVGRGPGSGAATDGYQEVLDALNTYPTLTIGVGQGKSSYWHTEPSKVSITIDDGKAATPAPEGNADAPTPAPTPAPEDNNGKGDGKTPTGDSANVAVFAAVAVAACGAVVASKKKLAK